MRLNCCWIVRCRAVSHSIQSPATINGSRSRASDKKAGSGHGIKNRQQTTNICSQVMSPHKWPSNAQYIYIKYHWQGWRERTPIRHHFWRSGLPLESKAILETINTTPESGTGISGHAIPDSKPLSLIERKKDTPPTPTFDGWDLQQTLAKRALVVQVWLLPAFGRNTNGWNFYGLREIAE